MHAGSPSGAWAKPLASDGTDGRPTVAPIAGIRLCRAHFEAMHPVTVVSVAYNSSGVLPAMLDSIPAGVPAIVVDNGSKDASETAVIAGAHGAHLIQNQENLGFGRACNQGAELVDTELIFFLNPDAVILDGALDHLVSASLRFPHASGFNPALRKANGKQLFRRSSTIDPKGWRLPKGWPEGDREVPVLSGAAMMVRKCSFEAIAGFDSEIFLYHEDDDLSLRLREQCGPLMFVRAARVMHQAGRSSGLDPATSYLKGLHMGRSRVYASLKHGKPIAFERALLSAVGAICVMPRLLSARRRSKSIGYLAGILGSYHLVLPTVSRLKNWWGKRLSG